MTLRFHVGSQDMQGKVNCPVMIVVAGYLITIALRELLYLNSSLASRRTADFSRLLIYEYTWLNGDLRVPLAL